MLDRSLSAVLLTLWATCNTVLCAQERWRFDQVTTAEGLSDNAITCLHQDRGGRLWIGTENGLCRYDGHTVRTWHRSDGLSGDQVSAVLEDAGGIVWVATRDGGLTRLDPRTGAVRAFRHDGADEGHIATDRLLCLYDLNDSTLLIGAEQYPLIFLDKRSFRCSYWSGKGPISAAHALRAMPPTADWCHSLIRLPDGRVVAALLLGHRQWVFDPRSGTILGDPFTDLPNEETITTVAQAGQLLCGVGWQRTLTISDPARPGATTGRDLPDQGTALLALDSGRVLIGTRSSGLLMVDPRNGATRSLRHRRSDRRTLADDRIRCLLRDAQGRTWVGTQHGLSVHDPESDAITTTPLLPPSEEERSDVTPYALVHTGANEHTICTSDGLFVVTDAGTVRRVRPSIGGVVLHPTCLHRSALGTFLGAEEGPFMADAHWGDVSPFARDWRGTHGTNLTDLFQVRSIYADTLAGHPTLVTGVAGYGLTLFDLQERHFELLIQDTRDPRSLGNNLTRQVLRTREGNYWVATAGGLYRWELDRAHPGNTFTAFRHDSLPHTLPGNDVQALAEAADGTLYVATRDGGLCRWRSGAFERLHCPRTLGNSMLGLCFDRDGRLWCATADGVEVFDPRDGSFMHLAIPGTNGPAALNRTIATLGDGRVGLVAENTFFRIAPERIPQQAAVASPYLTAVALPDGDISERLQEGRLRLGADERMLTLSLSALDLSGGRDMRFTLRLDGLDGESRMADVDGRITYSSLPSGVFGVRVRAIDGHGRQGPEQLLFTLHVAAPVWQRWWAITGVVVIIAAAVWAWSRYRIRQALKLHAVRDRIASDLHDEVGSSLSAINIGSQLAAQLSAPENEQVKQLMERIGRTSSESLRSMSDIVWAIDPKNDEGEALVVRMRRIVNELLQQKGVQVTFTVGAGVEGARLAMNARKELLLLFKEAVHNISKHADARSVIITLERTRDELVLAIADDGRGFELALRADGHGLGSMQRRADTLRGDLQIESAPGTGTRITLRIRPTKIRD